MSRRPEADRASLRARKVGMLFQSGNLLDHLTVDQNMRLVQRLVGSGRSRTHCRVARRRRLARSGDIDAGHLSGGEAARAGLAVALANEPLVVLADEPTGELDEVSADRIMRAPSSTRRTRRRCAAGHAQSGRGGVRRSRDRSRRRTPRTVSCDDGRLADALVRATDVARTFGSGTSAVVAVHGASCQIYARQLIALTGPSGSGKTTLLHLLAGLDVPTAGTIEWPSDRDAAAVASGTDRNRLPSPLASAAPRHCRKRRRCRCCCRALTARRPATQQSKPCVDSDLESLSAKLPEELSGGQAQRVAVARVLAGRPQLILADEPTGQLDHGSGAVVVDALIRAARQRVPP